MGNFPKKIYFKIRFTYIIKPLLLIRMIKITDYSISRSSFIFIQEHILTTFPNRFDTS